MTQTTLNLIDNVSQASLVGDVTGTVGASVVTQAQSGAITFGSAGAITFAASDTVNILQIATTSATPGANITITPQASSYTAAGAPGSVIINIPSTGTDTPAGHGCFKVQENATTTFSVNKSTYWGEAAFFGDPSTTNAILYNNNNASDTYLNGVTSVGIALAGTYYAMIANTNTIAFGINLPAVNYSFGAITSFGSGAGVIAIENASTNPSGAITGGGVLYVDHTSGNLYFLGSSGTPRLISLA